MKSYRTGIQMVRGIAFFVMLAVFVPAPAHAYLDGGTVSMVLQVILASIVGAMVSIKMFWARIRQWFKNAFSRKSS